MIQGFCSIFIGKMEASLQTLTCKSCKQTGSGVYCAYCGQKLDLKRITFSNLLHEAFHFFTHLDRGFPHTLKKLFTAPGTMQRDYIEGNRVRHQKPFSMFLICATTIGVSLYWINIALINYFDAGDRSEALFFNKYMVLFLVGSLPFTTLVIYLFFYRSRYNFAEIGVLALYTLSAFFIIVTVINLVRFIWHDLETRYIELPIILIYNTITFINFFKDNAKWKVVLKSIACTLIFFIVVASLQDYLVDQL